MARERKNDWSFALALTALFGLWAWHSSNQAASTNSGAGKMLDPKTGKPFGTA